MPKTSELSGKGPLPDRTLKSFIEAREKQKEKRSDRKKLLYFQKYISL